MPGWLVLASGQTALTDEDFLFFVLSPTGFPVFLLGAALYTTAVVFEVAAMISKGVDGIITDHPGLAVKVREERVELKSYERMMIQLASFFGRRPLIPEQ